MKNKKIKITMMITVLFLGFMCFGTRNVKAVLQANPSTHENPATDYGFNWLTTIRQMECINQTMGLEEEIDPSTRLSTTDSNGIDVHMELSTEYGATAILAVSSYGSAETIYKLTTADTDFIRSTTGNNTGVFFTGNRYELTAGFDTVNNLTNNGADSRYYNLYPSSTNWNTTATISVSKVGDALGNASETNVGCWKWDNTVSYWMGHYPGGSDHSANYAAMARGGDGIFSLKGGINGNSREYPYLWNYNSNYGTRYKANLPSRGVAVCFENI